MIERTPALEASAGRRRSWPVATALGAAFGATFFLSISGLRFVMPTEIGWAMKFDWATHYFGWKYFRFEPWQWPPGTVHGYNAPVGTAVGLTDSLPLMAYLLKPLSLWLPEDVQYLGPWELLCFTLQGALAARLIGRWTGDVVPRLAAAALFVMAPMLLLRVAHAALCAHFLLLWCLLIATRPSARRYHWREWGLLGALSGLIQPYLAAMVAALLAATVLLRGEAAVARRLVAIAAAAITMLGGWWLSGMFTLGGPASLSADGLGTFSANLLAPISPYGWSRLLPEWPAGGEGQLLEGTHYYGAGLLALIATAVVWRVGGARPDRPGTVVPNHIGWPIVLVSLALGAVALSPRVTLADRVLVDLTGPWAAPLALFRSTGRFLWPLSYLAFTWAIATILTRASRRVATAVLLAAVAVQAYDLRDLHADRRKTAHDPAFYEWDNPFTSTHWARIARHFDHLVLAPPPQCATAAVASEPALWFATRYRLTVNTGTLSRGSDVARARYCERLRADFPAGRLDAASLYVVSSEDAARIEAAPGGNRCGRLDRVVFCTTAASYPVWQRYAEATP